MNFGTDFGSFFGSISEETALVFVSVLIGVYLIALIWGATNYIVRSISLFTIAKRRGLPNYGLAWVPVGYLWTVGNLADHYDATHGISRKWRKVLLWLAIIGAVLWIVLYICMLVGVLATSFTGDLSSMQAQQSFIQLMIGFYLGLIPFIMLTSASKICMMICYYKIFESCNPAKAVLLLLLSLLVPCAFPFCLLSCCKKDLGMPAAPNGGTPSDTPVNEAPFAQDALDRAAVPSDL